MPRKISRLRNLGPRCAEWLAQIGIHTEDDLRRIGAATAYRELVVREVVKPHRMLLYALDGALDDVDCVRLSRSRKRELEDEAEVTHSTGKGTGPGLLHRKPDKK
jgi:DNA transformation protein and related proteins